MPEHLRSGHDIRAVFRAGRPLHGRSLSLYGRVREDRDEARVAVIAGKKVGGAVDRNRAKRRLRAALDLLPLPPGVDLVVVASGTVLSDPFDRLLAECDRLLGRISAREAGQ